MKSKEKGRAELPSPSSNEKKGAPILRGRGSTPGTAGSRRKGESSAKEDEDGTIVSKKSCDPWGGGGEFWRIPAALH